MTHKSRTRYPSSRRRSAWAGWLAGVMLAHASPYAMAQAPAVPTASATAAASEPLDALVGPFALYPDDLVALILPASTQPLQLVQADRFLDKRKANPTLPLDDQWDDAVKSLLNYPEIVKMMSADLDWTSSLGEAVVTDQGAVLEAVQSFRRRAKAAGNLKSDDKQVVKAEQEIIIIQPANPQVIYVPQYTPSTVVTVGVAPIYGYYPAPYPSYYYPYAPGAAMAAGVIWGAAIGAAWSGNHYGYGGGNNTININRNTNINSGNTSANRSVSASQQKAGGSTAWTSNKQPGQVSSSVGKTPSTARVGDARAGGGGGGGAAAKGGGAGGAAGGAAARPSTQPSGSVGPGGAGAGSTRPSTQPAAGAGTSRSSGGGDAFSGYDSSGRQASKDSSRGASSRSSASSAGARSAPRGGGGRR